MNKMAEQGKKTLTVQQKVTYFYCFLIPYENNLCNLAWLIILVKTLRLTELKACPGINYLDKTCHTHSPLTVNISI